MRTMSVFQFAGAAALMVAGIATTRAAHATSGDCPTGTDGLPAGEFSWGQSFTLPEGKGQFVDTFTSNGLHEMIVNVTTGYQNGFTHLTCLQAYGEDNNLNVKCANYDNTNDGSSQSDATGDCNGSTLFEIYWF